jgi:hypothetical protein
MYILHSIPINQELIVHIRSLVASTLFGHVRMALQSLGIGLLDWEDEDASI